MKQNDVLLSPAEYRKREMWEVCNTKEELYWHVKTFLNIDLPKHCVDELSTSNPLDFLWSIYRTMLTNEGDFRHVVATSRNCMKCIEKTTLVATINGSVEIQYLKIGDKVYDEYDKEVTVIGVWDQGEQDCVDLVAKNQILATCTKTHRWKIWDEDNFGLTKAVQDWDEDDLLCGIDYCIPVKNITLENPRKCHCYDITVDSPTSLYCLQNGLVTHNTLCSAIIHFYAMLHFRRDCCQLAATRTQSQACIKYLDKFLMIPEVVDYADINNKEEKMLKNLPANSFTNKPDAKIVVMVATLKGTNSARASCFAGNTKVSILENGQNTTDTIENIYKRIEQKENILALCVNPKTRKIEHKPILAALKRENTSRIIVTTLRGNTVECTPDHPVAVVHNNETLIFRGIETREIGDWILGKDDEECSYDHITNIQYRTANHETDDKWVYDIEVELRHNLFSNNVLFHNCLISDEVELIDPDIMSEAANVADPTMREGFDPISIYLSSRKFAGGPLQSLIDEASDTAKDGTFLHKWSLADFMQKCPTYLHHPELPKIPALIHRDTLEVIWGETAAELENKSTYIEVLAHHGCKTCGAFIACQARSTKQPSASPSLRTAKFVAGRLRDVKDTKKIISQILNWKPESSGLVFPMFAPSLHVKESKAAYKWITRGTDFNPMNLTEEAYNKCLNSDDPTELKLVTPSKRDLYKILKQHNWKINWGIDWGYTDPAALVIIAYNRRESRAFVLHSELKTGYSNQDWALYCATNYGTAFAPDLVCPDMADAAAPTYFAKHYLPTRDTKPSRIETGVSQIRSLLWNVATQEVNYCILDDRLSADLVEEFQKWTHERTQTGYNFDKYDKDNHNHLQDAQRYCLDPFIAEADIHFAAQNRKEVSTEDLFEAARDPNNLDAQIALAKKQMSDHFLREHGIADLTPRFNIPFAIPLNQASESFTLNKEHIEAGKEGKRKGGIFFRFG